MASCLPLSLTPIRVPDGGRCDARYSEMLTEQGGPELESLACRAGPCWLALVASNPAYIPPPPMQSSGCSQAAAVAIADADAYAELACRQDYPKVLPFSRGIKLGVLRVTCVRIDL